MKKRADPERIRFVWEQINGFYATGTRGGVANRAGPGGDIDLAVDALYTACDAICQRLGTDPGRDRDADALLTAAEALARVCGAHMYRQGWADALR